MKSNKKADDTLREKLNNYSSPVPADLFESVAARRAEQKSPKALAWPLTAGALALSALLLFGLLWQQSANDASRLNTATQEEYVAAGEPAPMTGDSEKTLAEVNTSAETQNDNYVTPPAPTTDAVISPSASSSSSTVASENNFSAATDKQEATFSQNTEQETTPAATASTPRTLLDEQPRPEDPVRPTQDSEAENSDATAHRNAVFKVTAPLPTTALPVADTKYAAVPKIECGWESRKLYIYLDALTSLDMSFRTLTPKSSEFDAYALLRNRTEGVQESFSLGFRASAVTRGGLAARTGLVYSTIREAFNYRVYTDEEFYVTTRDEEGNVISVDTVIETRVDEYNAANRHTLIDVPLLVGYEFDKKRYNFAFNGGAFFNITATQEGEILNTNNEIVSINSANVNRFGAFKNSVGFSLYGSFAVNYKITPALHFVFEPYGRYYLDSFTTEEHPLEQNYFTAGMQVGLRMKM